MGLRTHTVGSDEILRVALEKKYLENDSEIRQIICQVGNSNAVGRL